jgi:hypothetical protein
VRLRGSFNVPLDGQSRSRLVREAARVLRPGGRLFVHVLVGDRPLAGPPGLPGPAAYVQHVPQEHEPVRLLEEAGLQGVEMVKFDAAPCFVVGGAQLRELQLVGWKGGEEGPRAEVLYRGPFREVRDDAGHVYRRGERVRVGAAAADRLRRGPLADSFLFLP